MKITSRLAMLLSLAVFAGCAPTPTFQEGPDAEVTHDGLTRMDGTIMDVVWARTDIDLTGYSKVMFDGVGVEFREVSGPYSGRAGTGTSAARRSNQTIVLRVEPRRSMRQPLFPRPFSRSISTPLRSFSLTSSTKR